MGYFPEWQDTVKGAHGGSYQVPLGGNTDKYRFASGQKDYQSYGSGDESLLMSRERRPISLTGGTVFRNDWRLE